MTLALGLKEIEPRRAWARAGIVAALVAPHVRVPLTLISVAIAHIGFASGCYEPALQDCTIQCDGPDQCPGGQACVDGFCASPGIQACNGTGQAVTVDAASVTTDTPSSPDTTALCMQRCGAGTCVGGVCTIDCSPPGACSGDITCPADVPCRVVCGDGSCGGKINCAEALSCDVDCTGSLSCDDDITCPSGECSVTCSGLGSCKHRVRCNNSCACDVQCSGAESCAEVAECPSTTCRLGNGCSSQLAGCDTCP